MYDVNSLHNEMLTNINDKYDKNIGSFVWDITRVSSIVDSELYEALQIISDKLLVANNVGADLELFIYERTGLTRKQAEKSIGEVTVTGNGRVVRGDLFETESGVQFKAIEDVTVVNSAKVKIEAVLGGKDGNVQQGYINKMPITLDGIKTSTNELATNGGFDEEEDVELLERYLNRISKPVTGANANSYREFALENSKVGDAKVIPLWNGVNTVKVVVIDRDKLPCNIETVQEVQQYIDPNSSGTGQGKAPIGAYCTVVSATSKAINVNASISLNGEFTLEEVKTKLEENIVNYLSEIAFKTNTISIARVGALILSTNGVSDYSNLQLNNGTTNVTVLDNEVPIKGVITIA